MKPWNDCPACPECGVRCVTVDGVDQPDELFRCSAKCGPLKPEALTEAEREQARQAQRAWDAECRRIRELPV